MKLSKRTEYALRAMIRFARIDPGQFIQARDLAKVERMPNKFLESVLLGLKRHGYLYSKVGSGGGYRMTRPPGQILIGELLAKLEARERINGTPARDIAPGEMGLRLVHDKLEKARATAFEKLTLEALADEVDHHYTKRDGMFYI